jgi:Polysulphide reductase, NrfD
MAFELQSSPEQKTGGRVDSGRRSDSVVLTESPQPTKPPPWKILVVADFYLSELATGLFSVSALGDLIAHHVFGAASQIGYLAAFPLIMVDLICLIADLGDPLRFHHMLRVVNLKSPMSTGMWILASFTVLSFISMCLAAAAFAFSAPELTEARIVVAGVGLAPALFVGCYKGVMLSATAQPVWKQMRWLGAELVSSAMLMGVAGLLMVALFLPVPPAVPGFVLAQKVLLLVNLAFTLLSAYYIVHAILRREDYLRITVYTLLACAGWILPLILTFLGNVEPLATAASLILASTAVLRLDLIMLPHRLS